MTTHKENKNQNTIIRSARKRNDDEFYTPRETVEAELPHYKGEFRGKRVLCNCDDPAESEFFAYFKRQFDLFGLDRLTGVYHASSKFFAKSEDKGHYRTITEDNRGRRTALEGDGDFRSEECLKLMDEADIVVTNPPFSLFHEFVAELMSRDKKFLIIGNMNAIAYRKIFSLIQSNQMWLGVNSASRFPYKRPSNEPMKLGLTCWYTNMPHSRRNEDLDLYKKYNEEEYPKYDNYDAINVDKAKEIPMDYYGEMGVPITFLERYNPKQFEIVGNERTLAAHGEGAFYLNDERKYARIIIKRKETA